MIYQHIDPVKVYRKRMSRNQIVIHRCMKQHLFDYKPGNAEVFRMEYLCDCTECLKFDFKNCVKTKEDNTHATPTTIFDHETECGLDDEDEYLKVFEFIEINSFVGLVSADSNEPVYIMKVEAKERANQEQNDEFGQYVPPGRASDL